jgi:hypothetical protein
MRARVVAGKASLANRRTLATLTLLESSWSRKKLAVAFCVVYQRKEVGLAAATWKDVARALEAAPAYAHDLSKSISTEKLGGAVQSWCRKLDQRNTTDLAVMHQQAFLRQSMKDQPKARVLAAEKEIASCTRASAKEANRRWHAAARKSSKRAPTKKTDLGIRAALEATRAKLAPLTRGPLDY